MSRYAVDMAEIEDNLRLVENTPPSRLSAHRQAGFTPVYAVIDDILSQAVETPTRYTPVDQIGNLYEIVRSNLTRLFQLAVFFDDHFPRDKNEKPSAHLLKILNKEWGVALPGLEDEHIWDILSYWYNRHLVWWKANRQSKRCFEDEDDLLLVSLLDQYRRSRRSGMSRRDREDDTATRDDGWEGRMALRYGPALSLTPPDSQLLQNSEWLAHETRLFVSTYLAWKRADFNHPELVDSIVLPCHPSDLEDFIRNAHLQVARKYRSSRPRFPQALELTLVCSGNLVMMLANMKELSDDEELATIAGLQTECVWITLDDGPDINESYRALPEPDTDSEDDGTGFRTGAPYRTLPPQFARWLPKGVAERQKELAALEEQNQTEEEDTEDDADGEQSEEQTEEDDDNDDNDNEDNEEEEGGDEDADGDEDEDDDSDEYNDNDEDEDFGDDDDDDFDGGDEGGVARNQVENINPDAYKKMYVGVKETRSGLKLYRI
jgi:hypothetical protein